MYTTGPKPEKDWLEFNNLAECKSQSKLYAKLYDRFLDDEIISGYSTRCVKL